MRIRAILHWVYFPIYLYIIFPTKSLFKPSKAPNGLNLVDGVLPVLLIGSFMLTNTYHLSNDIVDVPLDQRLFVEGEMVNVSRGVRSNVPVASLRVDGKMLKFSLRSVRCSECIDTIAELKGQKLRIWYQEAGRIWPILLPAKIESDSGRILYKYEEHRQWFLDPVTNFSKFLYVFFLFVSGFYLLYFPIRVLTEYKGTKK